MHNKTVTNVKAQHSDDAQQLFSFYLRSYTHVINRPGVAGAVLQTAS